MGVYALALIAFYVGAKLLVRRWLYRPSHGRPGFLRHNETLRTIDLVAMLALIGVFFMLINTTSIRRTVAVTVALLLYDIGLWALFIHLETKRLCASSKKWKYRNARRQVRRRARGSVST